MNIRFMANRYAFYTISVVLILASIIGLFYKGFNYGIDFKGGNMVHLTFNEPANEDKIRSAFRSIRDSFNAMHVAQKATFYFDPEQVVIQAVTGGQDREFIIQYPAAKIDSAETAKTHDYILTELKKAMPYPDETLEVSNVGPTLGDEMKKQGIIAAFLSCIGILLYLGYRFDFQSATGVVISVVHDLLITLGFICFLGTEFDTTVLAAVLTLLGYSVNDSIVILDRIRENKRISKSGTSYETLVDNSVNQSLSRTLNTTITTLLALVALVLYGGDSIHSFSVVLTFGCLIGTYSSNCLCGPMVADMFFAQAAKANNTTASAK